MNINEDNLNEFFQDIEIKLHDIQKGHLEDAIESIIELRYTIDMVTAFDFEESRCECM